LNETILDLAFCPCGKAYTRSEMAHVLRKHRYYVCECGCEVEPGRPLTLREMLAGEDGPAWNGVPFGPVARAILAKASPERLVQEAEGRVGTRLVVGLAVRPEEGWTLKWRRAYACCGSLSDWREVDAPTLYEAFVKLHAWEDEADLEPCPYPEEVSHQFAPAMRGEERA
jgi:hypothetical protein